MCTRQLSKTYDSRSASETGRRLRHSAFMGYERELRGFVNQGQKLAKANAITLKDHRPLR
jgi:hypothetical protein